MNVLKGVLPILVALVMVGCGKTEPEASPPPPPPSTDIWKASAEGSVSIVQQHIDAGTDVNGTFSLEGVPGTGGTPLHIALMTHKHDVAKLLIENGADINRKAIAPDPYGGTPMHWAIAFENISGVNALLEAGADPNSTDNYGSRPLDVALLDLTTFQPVHYESLSASKKSIYDSIVAKGGRH
jgi:ankyrin repeat protein